MFTEQYKRAIVNTIVNVLHAPEGGYIEAIKRVRVDMQCGLKDAKNLVDDVKAGVNVLACRWPTYDAPVSAAVTNSFKPKFTRKRWREIINEVHYQTTKGSRITACKILREATGCGLKEALDVTRRFKPMAG